MGRIANKKTGKLNKAYRDPSVFYGSSRGRKRNLWKSSKKRKTKKNKEMVYREITPEEKRMGRIGMLIMLGLIIGIILLVSFTAKINEKNKENITLEQLQSLEHPKVADNEDEIKKFYKNYNDVCFEHASEFMSDKTAILTWHYTSTYGDDSLNDLVIDFSKLSEEERKQLTFETVLDIAISFVPVEEILEYYAFDEAVCEEKEEYVSYELYYKEIDEKESERPFKYYQDHGFSIVVREYDEMGYKVFIETSWYDFAYNLSSFADEKVEGHQEWKFSLEEYVNSR